MSTINTHSANQEIRDPVLREPNAYIEYIYPVPGTEDTPDIRSQDIMGEYILSRFEPDPGPRTRVVLTPIGHSLPGFERVPAGFKEVGRWRKMSEWLVSPQLAAVVTLGSTALFNTVGNVSTISGAAQYTEHAIYRVFNPVPDDVITVRTPVITQGSVSDINVLADTSNEVGSTIVDPNVVGQFVSRIRQAEQQGAQVIEIDETGNTSDEWANDASIGVSDSSNTSLGLNRAQAAQKAIAAAGLNINPAQIKMSQLEHVIGRAQKADLLATAKADGFSSIQAAITAVDSQQAIPTDLVRKIEQPFTGKQNRGVSLSAKVQYPGKIQSRIETTHKTVKGRDHKPNVPTPDFYGFIPLPPIRRRERYTEVKEMKRWQFTPSKPLMRPEIIREEVDQSWVRLRPEALREDGTLVDNAWAYTRKYEHLLRDKRVADVLRAEYQDSKGAEKSLRIIFVDEQPALEVVKAFEVLLHKFAAMEDGKLGNRISGIFVYPSENTGTDHDNPKRIALGIDKQSPEELLGSFTYALDLVELHMPTKWETEDLLELFESFNGPAWVASHEVAGHGTDENDQPLHLRPVRTRHISNAYVITDNPRAQKMSRLDKILSKLPSRRAHKTHPIEFDISYPVTDNNGQIVTLRARVNEHDPRLAHATETTIVGHRPTHYAGTNSSEHYAETAAAVTTGIAIPYSEAYVTVPELRTDGGRVAVFANGYRPDARGQRLFTDSVSAVPGAYPVRFKTQPKVMISHLKDPASDPLLQQELARTSHLRSLRPNQMIAVLARVARSRRYE